MDEDKILEVLVHVAENIMINYPEFNQPWARCVSAMFSEGRYSFVKNDGERVVITSTSVAKAIGETIDDWVSEKCHFDKILSQRDLLEPENYDETVTDYVVQIALYGEKLYS